MHSLRALRSTARPTGSLVVLTVALAILVMAAPLLASVGSVSSCQVECECASLHGSGDHEASAAAAPSHDCDGGCDDEGPFGCPDCACCPGLSLAVRPIFQQRGVTTVLEKMRPTHRLRLAVGEAAGLFRPPRPRV